VARAAGALERRQRPLRDRPHGRVTRKIFHRSLASPTDHHRPRRFNSREGTLLPVGDCVSLAAAYGDAAVVWGANTRPTL
jgi:hypothetical protein